MLDRKKVFTSFRRALARLISEVGEGPRVCVLRPRTVALLAHEIYCTDLRPGEKRPASETFRKFATGQLPFPEVVELLLKAGIRPARSTRLNRQRVRSVFEEAIQRLETRLLKGQARPRQIIRRAYDLYTRDADAGAPQPSRRTFERLLYGKLADRELLTLVENVLKKKE